MRVIKELIRENLISNVTSIKKALKAKTKVYAVVKSDAYGNGLEEVVRTLDEFNYVNFVVANVDEAKRVRKISWLKDILIVGGFDEEKVADIKAGDFTVGISSYKEAKKINDYSKKLDRLINLPKIKVHIKINTGMNRLGFDIRDESEFEKDIEKILKLDFIEVTGIYSHLSEVDDEEVLLKEQESFDRAVEILFEKAKEKNIETSKIVRHLLNTVGLLNGSLKEYDAVRVGLGLYGYYTSPKLKEKWTKKHDELKPCLVVKSKINFIRKLKEGECVSYAGSFTASENLTIAIVESGYDDGFIRAYSNKVKVKVAGKEARVIGNVCMNLFMIDITDIHAKEGDDVIILDDKMDAERLALAADTIVDEVLCNFK